MKTLRRCPIEKVQVGDGIIRNGKHYEIDYIEKDVHGYDVYALDLNHRRIYFFVGDNETVTLDQ